MTRTAHAAAVRCILHLTEMGIRADIMTPNRHKEGYGLSADAVRQIAAAGTTLIVTVDCGITNVSETALAKSLGVDVIITDHHECADVLPDTPYIINPKRPDSDYPWMNLAGCGVAFKLIHALSTLRDALRYIDLIAVGTITDIVPMQDENRVIAFLGHRKNADQSVRGHCGPGRCGRDQAEYHHGFRRQFHAGTADQRGRKDGHGRPTAIDVLKTTEPSAALNAAARDAVRAER